MYVISYLQNHRFFIADENTRSKFLFYGGKDYLQAGGLLDYIPKDLIPDFLGGPCKVRFLDHFHLYYTITINFNPVNTSH